MATGQTILREYLMSLGFKVDTTGQRKWDTAVTSVNKGALAAGFSVAGLAATIGVLAERYANAMEKMYYAGRRSGTPVAQLKAMDYAGQQVGLAAGKTTQIVNTMAAALRMNKGLVFELTRLGIKTVGRTPAQEIMDLIDKTASMNYNKGARIAAQFGLDEDSYQVMRQNRVEMRAAMEEQLALYKELGVDQDANAKSITQWKKETRSMVAMFDILEGVLAGKLLPTMEKIVGQTKTWTNGLIKDLSAANGFVDFLGKRADRRQKEGREGITFNNKNMPWDSDSAGTIDIEGFRRWLVGVGHPAGWADKRLGPRHQSGGGVAASGGVAAASSGGATNNTAKLTFLSNLDRKYGLPDGMMAAIWDQESTQGTNPNAFNGKGKGSSIGDFQITKKTAAAYGGWKPDFESQADQAARIMVDNIKQFHDLGQALTAYNAGGAVAANPALGTTSQRAYAGQVMHRIEQVNNITINGGGPTVASAVRQGLGQANGDLVRNMKTVVQ